MSGGTGSGRGPLVSRLEFGPLATAVPCARLHTRLILAEWNLSRVSATAELVVSELVTNSLKATWAAQMTTPVGLCLMADDKYLSIEVWDGIEQIPVPREHDIDAEGGRGLEIISTLCAHWDTYFPGSGGKVVCATITVK